MSYINQTNNQDNPQKIESSEGLIYAALKMQPYESSEAADYFIQWAKATFDRAASGPDQSKPFMYIMISNKEIVKMRKTRLKKLWKQQQ